MQIFRDLRKLYNDAGVTIYAVKNLSVNASDEDLEFQFTVARRSGPITLRPSTRARTPPRRQARRRHHPETPVPPRITHAQAA
jgi:hypothetical protein